MTTPTPIKFEAEVDLRERPALVAGVHQLAEALGAATGVDWPIQLRFWDTGRLTVEGSGAVIVLSLLADVERDEAFAQTEARWRVRTGDLAKTGAPILICTVFRHVADRLQPAGARKLERIRRLNRLAADLSHDLGVEVVDIDRAFAHIGGRVLSTDYRLQGRLAAEVAGHSLIWAMLSLGWDDAISPEVQERAMAFHGPLRQIDTLVRRRLAQG